MCGTFYGWWQKLFSPSLFTSHFVLSLSLQIVFQNQTGRYDLEVTTFQMAVLFTWNQRPEDSISFESLR